MIRSIKQTLLTGWHPMRWIYLVFGVFCLSQAFWYNDTFIGYIGGLALLMALANMGCCGPDGCAVPTQDNKTEKSNK